MMTKQLEKLMGLFKDKGDMGKLLVDGLGAGFRNGGKDLPPEDKERFEQWSKLAQSLEQKGATAKEYVDAYYDIAPASWRQPHQGDKSLRDRLDVINVGSTPSPEIKEIAKSSRDRMHIVNVPPLSPEDREQLEKRRKQFKDQANYKVSKGSKVSGVQGASEPSFDR